MIQDYEAELEKYRLGGMLSVIGSFRVDGRFLVWEITDSKADLINHIHTIAKVGNTSVKQIKGRAPLYTWTIRNTDAVKFFMSISPYLERSFAERAKDKVSLYLNLLLKATAANVFKSKKDRAGKKLPTKVLTDPGQHSGSFTAVSAISGQRIADAVKNATER